MLGYECTKCGATVEDNYELSDKIMNDIYRKHEEHFLADRHDHKTEAGGCCGGHDGNLLKCPHEHSITDCSPRPCICNCLTCSIIRDSISSLILKAKEEGRLEGFKAGLTDGVAIEREKLERLREKFTDEAYQLGRTHMKEWVLAALPKRFTNQASLMRWYKREHISQDWMNGHNEALKDVRAAIEQKEV